MTVIWTNEAEQDRWRIMEYYIAKDCPEIALTLDEQISFTVDRLKKFPYSGRPGRIMGAREAIIGSYILVYKVLPDCLLITHLVHGAMLFPPLHRTQ